MWHLANLIIETNHQNRMKESPSRIRVSKIMLQNQTTSKSQWFITINVCVHFAYHTSIVLAENLISVTQANGIAFTLSVDSAVTEGRRILIIKYNMSRLLKTQGT